MIEIFKNTPPRSKFILMKRYENVSFQQQYSIKIIEDFFQKFPEEKQGRKNFKDKEIQSFDTFLLRNGGSDWFESMIRDGLTHSLYLNIFLNS